MIPFGCSPKLLDQNPWTEDINEKGHGLWLFDAFSFEPGKLTIVGASNQNNCRIKTKKLITLNSFTWI